MKVWRLHWKAGIFSASDSLTVRSIRGYTISSGLLPTCLTSRKNASHFLQLWALSLQPDITIPSCLMRTVYNVASSLQGQEGLCDIWVIRFISKWHAAAAGSCRATNYKSRQVGNLYPACWNQFHERGLFWQTVLSKRVSFARNLVTASETMPGTACWRWQSRKLIKTVTDFAHHKRDCGST